MARKEIKSGYEVVGPNTADYRESRWYFPSLADARRFAEHIALEVDAAYDIYLHVGRVQQKPLEHRPLEFTELPKPEEPPDSYAQMGRVEQPATTVDPPPQEKQR